MRSGAQYDAIVMIDESHSSGFMGKTGRGVHELCNVMDKVDIITGTQSLRRLKWWIYQW